MWIIYIVVAILLWFFLGVTYAVVDESITRQEISLELKLVTTIWAIIILVAFSFFAYWMQSGDHSPAISSLLTNKSVLGS